MGRILHKGLCGYALNSLKQLKEVSGNLDKLQAAALVTFLAVN